MIEIERKTKNQKRSNNLSVKIRVLHLIHQLGSGGAENGIINLLNQINNDKFSTALCVFVGKGDQTFRLDRKRNTLFELNKRSGNDITIPLKLVNIFRKWKPHIVHTHAWGTLCEGVIAAKLARIPIIIHGEHGTIQQKRKNILVQRFFWGLADQILSVSNEHAKQLSKTTGFCRKKIRVINNGVDINRYSPRKDIKSLRKALNIQKDDIVIGKVGRLVPVKNQSLLIKAFSNLAQRYPNIKLILAGEGPLMEELQKQSYDLGYLSKILFLGRRSDIPQIMATLDVFALTSHSEGMSNTILEAMSSRLPVVATAVGGNPELIVNCRTGILTPSNNVSALTEALEILIQYPELRERMGQAGRSRAKHHFSLNAMVSNYEQLYLRCFEEKAMN